MKSVLSQGLWLFSAALVCASLAVPAIKSVHAAGSPDLTGDWAIHNSISGNESDMDCSFSQEENKISGKCKSAGQELAGQTLKVTGTVDGKKATWKYDAEYQGNIITLTYNATVDDPEKISGTVDVEPYDVSGDFTAKRAKAQK